MPTDLHSVAEPQRLFVHMALSKRKFVDPAAVMGALLDSSGNPVKIGNQEDVSEFNHLFLQRVQQGMKAAVRAPVSSPTGVLARALLRALSFLLSSPTGARAHSLARALSCYPRPQALSVARALFLAILAHRRARSLSLANGLLRACFCYTCPQPLSLSRARSLSLSLLLSLARALFLSFSHLRAHRCR